MTMDCYDYTLGNYKIRLKVVRVPYRLREKDQMGCPDEQIWSNLCRQYGRSRLYRQANNLQIFFRSAVAFIAK